MCIEQTGESQSYSFYNPKIERNNWIFEYYVYKRDKSSINFHLQGD